MSQNDRIKELTKELEELDCKKSNYNLRSEQILHEIKLIVRNENQINNTVYDRGPREETC